MMNPFIHRCFLGDASNFDDYEEEPRKLIWIFERRIENDCHCFSSHCNNGKICKRIWRILNDENKQSNVDVFLALFVSYENELSSSISHIRKCRAARLNFFFLSFFFFFVWTSSWMFYFFSNTFSFVFYCIDRHGIKPTSVSFPSLSLLHSISLSSSFCSSSFSRILWVFTNWSCTVVLGVVVLMSFAYKIYVLLSVFLLLLLLSVFWAKKKQHIRFFPFSLSIFFGIYFKKRRIYLIITSFIFPMKYDFFVHLSSSKELNDAYLKKC